MISIEKFGDGHFKIAHSPNNYQIIPRNMLNFGRSGDRLLIRNAITNGVLYNLRVTDIESFKGNIDEAEKQLLELFYGSEKKTDTQNAVENEVAK